MDLHTLPTVNNLDCKHRQSFAQCNHCKGKSASKMGTLRLLDSGASLHFTHNFNDFIEYETAKLADWMSVRTASDIVHIEGKSTVLIEHKVNNKLVQTQAPTHPPWGGRHPIHLAELTNQRGLGHAEYA
jgi:hypothetical protein